MKKENFKLKKVSLGKLTSNEMSELLGGSGSGNLSRSDSQSTRFTEIYSCCNEGCPTKTTGPVKGKDIPTEG